MKYTIATLFSFCFLVSCNDKKEFSEKKTNSKNEIESVLGFVSFRNVYNDDGSENPNPKTTFVYYAIDNKKDFMVCENSEGLYKIEFIGQVSNASIFINKKIYQENITFDNNYVLRGGLFNERNNELEIKSNDSTLFKCSVNIESCD